MKTKDNIVIVSLAIIIGILIGILLLVSKAEAVFDPAGLANQVENEFVSANVELTEYSKEIVPKTSHKSSGSYIKVQPQYVWNVLKLGDRGENVKTFQKVLNYQINAGLVVDGIYGNLTHNAWLAYQLTLK